MILARLPVPSSKSRKWSAGKIAWFACAAFAATVALARARWELRHLVGRDIAACNARAGSAGLPGCQHPHSADVVDHISRVVPRMAGLVPWRSDCLVQALAGQYLLSRFGIASRIVIGARKDTHGAFSPHAWLACEGRTVTGGDVSGYEVLLGEG
ncbi:MAG: lasso peptide biosynthesis B2 protein [Alteraurantiacibacter sp.]|nr:lasso peptide biosynthesis B2 protein [Alteraurantiacibacter sp.]